MLNDVYDSLMSVFLLLQSVEHPLNIYTEQGQVLLFLDLICHSPWQAHKSVFIYFFNILLCNGGSFTSLSRNLIFPTAFEGGKSSSCQRAHMSISFQFSISLDRLCPQAHSILFSITFNSLVLGSHFIHTVITPAPFFMNHSLLFPSLI